MKSWVEQNNQLFCFLVGLLCALPLMFLTPPFQVPDEPQHFYRAYQISELHLVPEAEGRIAGGRLPTSLIELSSFYLESRAIHTERPVIKRPWSALLDGFAIPLLPKNREFIDFSGGAFYSPIPYIPQALAIAAGRISGAGPLALMYLARFFNAVAAIFLLSLAVRCSPMFKPGFMVAGLLPMSLYLYASLSPDAMVISSAFLFTALALRAHVEKKWAPRDFVTAVVCATIFCSIKVVYAPLLLISLVMAFKSEFRGQALRVQVVLVVIPIAITAAWLHAVSGVIVPVKTGTSVAAQMQYVAAHPLRFLQAARHGFLWNGFYFFTTIGVLGWLTVKLPAMSYVLPIIAFSISVFSLSPVKPVRPTAVFLWWGFLATSSIGLVMLALYLYWTVVAGVMVEGVQGRYFIPVIPLFGVVIAAAISTFKRKFPASQALICVAALTIAEAVLTFFALSESFWEL